MYTKPSLGSIVTDVGKLTLTLFSLTICPLEGLTTSSFTGLKSPLVVMIAYPL